MFDQRKKITKDQIAVVAQKHDWEYKALFAVAMVEGSGHGFDETTGKMLIQFEPAWYRRLDAIDGFSGHGVWEENKVERQSGEWTAFNDAFSKDSRAAMESTSIGMMQVMGFHWKSLGFDSVGAMWDFAKESEANQLELGARFISMSPRLNAALKAKDWKTFAYYYNGPNYKINSYDLKLAMQYKSA